MKRKDAKLEKILKEKEAYIDNQIEKALQYEKDVESGKIIASKWIKLAIKRRHKLEKKYYFSEERVRDIFGFFFYINLYVGKELQRFDPFPWMAWVVYNTHGYHRDEKCVKKLFRYVTIWVGRKSGKTYFSSILSLYALMKGEREAEVYFCATTKDQASQALRYLKEIVKNSPALRKRVKRQQYKLIYEGNGSCVARPVANEPDKLDGLKPSFAIVDEKHAFPDNNMFNIMKTGILACEDPQIVTISTSGLNRDFPFYKELELGKKALDGDIEDDNTFHAYFTLDDEDEIDNPEMWIKANPSLKDENGVGIISLEDLVVDYKKACLQLADKSNFITKNLNIYTDSVDTWIPDNSYRKCFNEVKIEELKGCKAYMGIDLAKTRDLASLVLVVEHPETKKMQIIPEFYFPTEAGENKIRESGIDLSEWIEQGWIIPHYGNTIDFKAVFDRIEYWCDYFEIDFIGYDPWFSHELVSMVESKIMVDMMPLRQNTGTFTFPMKFFERLIFSENIDCSKSPVMRWNIRNCVPYYGGNGDCKLMKNKSLDAIDGAVAMLMALAVYANDNFDALNIIMNGDNEQ